MKRKYSGISVNPLWITEESGLLVGGSILVKTGNVDVETYVDGNQNFIDSTPGASSGDFTVSF